MAQIQNIFQEFNGLIKKLQQLIEEYELLHKKINRSEWSILNFFNHTRYVKHYKLLSEHEQKFEPVVSRINEIIESHQQEIMAEFLQQYLFMKSFHEYVSIVYDAVKTHVEIEHDLAHKNNPKFNLSRPKGFTERYIQLYDKLMDAELKGKEIVRNLEKFNKPNEK